MAGERDSIEDWALAIITSCDLEQKFSPPAAPLEFAARSTPLRVATPGRPPEVEVVLCSPKTPRPGALARPRARAQLLHTFAHHEVQAAELFLMALLAFPETPEAFRRGLVTLAGDEFRHARLYRAEIERLGFGFGDFPVRDWFWQRLAPARSALEFVALMGIGFEGANLDHAEVWARRFEAVGDEQGARCQRTVGEEEIAHVRFAVDWFCAWTGELSFQSWRAELPAPLTPAIMRARPFNAEARQRAGLDARFLEDFEAWTSAPSGI
ncbi:MAG: DUF455 family protein [bacterium]|nr:DUF455 family protein [Planctomycetota bacterium]HIL51745.1 DUF455 family protein [Planctomycetota bacterium]